DPSMPKPSSNELSSSMLIGYEMCCVRPGISVKRRSTCRASFFFANSKTSCGVIHFSVKASVSGTVGPVLQQVHRIADRSCREQDKNSRNWYLHADENQY